MPLPNTQGAAFTNANNYYAAGSGLLDIDQIDGRFDHNFTTSHRMFVRVSKRNQDDEPAVLWPADIALAEDRINQRNRMYNGVLDYTGTPNANTIVNGRIAFARSLYFYENQGLDFPASSLGLPSALDTAGGLTMFPRFTATNYASLGNTDNRYNVFMTYTAAGSVTRIQGSHTFKAGYEGRMIRVNNRESRSTSGDFGFTQGFTQGPNPTQAAVDRGNAIASLLLGTGSGSLIQSFKDAAAQSFYTGLYFQDDWRATNKLTLNLGVRYDLDSPRTERFDRMNYFDPISDLPISGTGSWLSRSARRSRLRRCRWKSAFAVHLGQEQFRSTHRIRIPADGQDDDPRRMGQLLRAIAAAGTRNSRPIRLSDADTVGGIGRWHHA